MRFIAICRLSPVLAALLLASQLSGCDCLENSPGRKESTAVEQLRAIGYEVVRASGYSTEPTVVQLTNEGWVAEMLSYDNLLWDYRRTSSMAMPFEGVVGCTVARWITKPYPTKQAAETAAKDRSVFFQVAAECSTARSYPIAPEKIYSPSKFVVEAVFDARESKWKLKGVQLGDFSQQRELWTKRFIPVEQPMKK
ncbi:MAG: hypothetical protein WCJ35_03295 [Planctomycetota bacterium]